MYFHRYTFGTFAVVVITFFYSESLLVLYTIINLSNEYFIILYRIYFVLQYGKIKWQVST